jgi:hypothetical protein
MAEVDFGLAQLVFLTLCYQVRRSRHQVLGSPHIFLISLIPPFPFHKKVRPDQKKFVSFPMFFVFFVVRLWLSQAKINCPYSKPFHSGQKRLPPFQAILVMPKPTSSISSHSSQTKTDFCHSKPFQSVQKQLSPFQAIPVRSKTDFCHSQPLQSDQNQLLPFQAITVRPKPTSSVFWDNTSTYFFGYKIHNKINQLKGDRIGVIPRCRAWL